MVTKQTAKSYICILANSKEIRKNSNRNHISLYKPHRVNGVEMPVTIINIKNIADWCSNDRKAISFNFTVDLYESGSFRPESRSTRESFCPGSFRHCKYLYFGCCKACSWVLYFN